MLGLKGCQQSIHSTRTSGFLSGIKIPAKAHVMFHIFKIIKINIPHAEDAMVAGPECYDRLLHFNDCLDLPFCSVLLQGAFWLAQNKSKLKVQIKSPLCNTISVVKPEI
jgi:hypothetical protein